MIGLEGRGELDYVRANVGIGVLGLVGCDEALMLTVNSMLWCGFLEVGLC